MLSRRVLSAIIPLALFSLPPLPAAADNAGAYTLDQVIVEVLRYHPDLVVSSFDPAIAETEEMRIDSELDTAIDASVGIRDDQAPVVSEFQPSETFTGTLAGSVTKPLESGATLSATAEYSKTRQSFTSQFANQLAVINPSYRGGLSVNYRHPLLRGEGRPEYRDALAAAEAETEAARLQRYVSARDLGLETLDAGFRLLANDISIRQTEVGVDRAQRLLDYQMFREEFGLVEAADRIQVEALLATRRLELQRARSRKQENRVELNRLMVRDPAAALELQPFGGAGVPPIPSIEAGVDDARETRPEFRLLDLQLEAEQARLRIARNAGQPQLDLVAEYGVFALERDPLDATMFDINDRIAGLSVEFSEVFGNRRAKADILRSELTSRRIQARINQTVEQVRDQLALIHSTLVTGEETLRLLRQRAEAERRKFEAEMERYRGGRSDTATIIEFEADLHAAELEAELQILTLWLADRQFSWTRGALFEEMGIDLDAMLGDIP